MPISQPNLEVIIADILKKVGHPLASSVIAEIIASDDLWHRPSDGHHPAASQISARVNNYDHLFERKNGLINLRRSINQPDRMFRLTWNTTGWQFPIQHRWKKQNQGTRIAFENQYGFGGEEWLFNPRYQYDGYQYGYIRGVADLTAEVNQISNAILFTLNQETRERFFVGQINGLEIIHNSRTALSIAQQLYSQYLHDMEEELIYAKADLNGLGYGVVPNVRFQIRNANLFAEKQPAVGLKGNKYNRYIPYKIEKELESIIEGSRIEDYFHFNPGVAKSSFSHERFTEPANDIIKREHSEISKALEQFLQPTFSSKKNNLSIEKTRFGYNIADVVLNHPDGEITIIEIKSSGLVRKNIREAIGQLLDYGCWYKECKVKKLIIVAPSELSLLEIGYLERLRNVINIPVGYWQYQHNPLKGTPNFLEFF
ncbi:hypothetical protein [Sphingobacterium siyangense]|uniref:hypothetical protein n=1 Tax=Sphingobacterium siyangense TaxID=459529 RepID=UPI002FDD002F